MKKGRKGKKKGYFVKYINDEFGYGVVARSTNEAKMLFWKFDKDLSYNDFEYIDIRVNERKNAEIHDLPIGVVDDGLVGLKASLFDHTWGICPICEKEDDYIYKKEDLIGCSQCLSESCIFYDKENDECNCKPRMKEISWDKHYDYKVCKPDCDPEDCKFWKELKDEEKQTWNGTRPITYCNERKGDF